MLAMKALRIFLSWKLEPADNQTVVETTLDSSGIVPLAEFALWLVLLHHVVWCSGRPSDRYACYPLLDMERRRLEWTAKKGHVVICRFVI